MALGARTSEVMAMVLGQGLRTTAIAIALGLAGSLVATRLLQAQLFGVAATDPLIFMVVPGLLAVVAIAACYAPARRASSVDPVSTLRGE
jgi:ABC-type antimicrobial peptide transport system permease subunit